MTSKNDRFGDQLDRSRAMPGAEEIFPSVPSPIPLRRAAQAIERTRFGAFKITPTGLEVGEGAQEKDWREAGAFIFQVESGIQWLIGDWLAYGLHLAYGDMPKIAEIAGRDESTLHTYKQMAENIEYTRRRVDLSFAHHQEVRRLTAEQQDYALAHAAEKGLTRAEFRQWIREQKGQATPPSLPSGEFDIDATARDLKKFMHTDPAKLKPDQFQATQSEVQNQLRQLDRIAANLRQRWDLEE